MFYWQSYYMIHVCIDNMCIESYRIMSDHIMCCIAGGQNHFVFSATAVASKVLFLCFLASTMSQCPEYVGDLLRPELLSPESLSH
jgi:hypothetical protein